MDEAPGDLGNALDEEFDDIALTAAQILANLTLVQRDDGALANGIVTPFSLSLETVAMLGDWTIRGAWVTATLYSPLDLVTHSGTSYLGLIQHVAGTFATDLAAGKWVSLGIVATSIPFTPTGTIVSTDVQSAIAEVSGDVTDVSNTLTAHIADAADAHDASAISNVPAGSIAATDVQAAVNELDSTITALFPDKVDIAVNTVLASTAAFVPRRITASAVVTLPSAATCDAGDPFILKSYTTGDVTIAPNGADTIDGINASLRLASFECIELRPSGTDWIVTKKPAWEVGNVKAHDGTAIPQGWIARGGVVSRSTYAGLFAICGTTFDPGDGSTFGAGAPTAGRALIGEGTGTVSASGVNADVDTSTDALTVASNVDKWVSTMAVAFTLSSGTITGLTSGNTYYVVRASATTIKLASSLANAQNGVVVDMTAKSSPVWTITHAYTTRNLGDHTGQEVHAMSSAELLSHPHGMTSSNTGPGFGSEIGSVGVSGSNQGKVTLSAGGNAAMNIMSPSSVTKFIIKT